jgi:hypothetical protein
MKWALEILIKFVDLFLELSLGHLVEECPHVIRVAISGTLQ